MPKTKVILESKKKRKNIKLIILLYLIKYTNHYKRVNKNKNK